MYLSATEAVCGRGLVSRRGVTSVLRVAWGPAYRTRAGARGVWAKLGWAGLGGFWAGRGWGPAEQWPT